MCLAVLALNAHPDWPLIIIANRDEYHARPTEPAKIWDKPQILAGRDLRAGGTWLGVSLSGKIGLLTNYREPGSHNPSAPSRGGIVEQYLASDISAEQYIKVNSQESSLFNGYNLLLADQSQTVYFSNRFPSLNQNLSSGIYGLSNATLDVDWPKVIRTREAVSARLSVFGPLNTESLFEIFRDCTPASDECLPDTGLTLARERKLSSPFILDELYGTRCSTVLMKNTLGQIYFEEHSFDPKGEIIQVSRWCVDPKQKVITAIT